MPSKELYIKYALPDDYCECGHKQHEHHIPRGEDSEFSPWKCKKCICPDFAPESGAETKVINLDKDQELLAKNPDWENWDSAAKRAVLKTLSRKYGV